MKNSLLGFDRGFAAMALRAVKMLGEQCAAALGANVRGLTASRNLWDAKPVRGPGAPGSVSGTKDMDTGERESVTEGSESPKDVAESMKKHEDAGKTDSAGDDLKGKPVAQAAAEEVREDLAGSSQ